MEGSEQDDKNAVTNQCACLFRWLTNRVVPGMRTVIMGIYSIYQNKAAVSYMRAEGTDDSDMKLAFDLA
jgi:hypothetical protein